MTVYKLLRICGDVRKASGSARKSGTTPAKTGFTFAGEVRDWKSNFPYTATVFPKTA